jgi:DNA modification methylase
MNISKRWQLLHGDCRELLTLLEESSISCVITDPPYNYEFIGRNWTSTWRFDMKLIIVDTGAVNIDSDDTAFFANAVKSIQHFASVAPQFDTKVIITDNDDKTIYEGMISAMILEILK